MGFLDELNQIFMDALEVNSPKQKKELKDAWRAEVDHFVSTMEKAAVKLKEGLEESKRAEEEVKSEQTTRACDGIGCPWQADINACVEEMLDERRMISPDAILVFQCPTCQGSIDEGDRFCRYCGQPIDWTDWLEDDDIEDELNDDEEDMYDEEE